MGAKSTPNKPVKNRDAFGRHVRSPRKARGLTQDQRADRYGLAADTIRRLEHGSFSLAKMPEHYRCVVELCFAGHDSLQIAAALGLNYNTARSRLSRGRAMLRAAYEGLLNDGV